MKHAVSIPGQLARCGGLALLCAVTMGSTVGGNDGVAPSSARSAPVRRTPDLTNMIKISASTFSMGHPIEAPGPYGQPWKENELPAHLVTLPEYYIDQDEVTAAEYARFLSEAGGPAHWHPLQPIVRSGEGFVPVKDGEDLPVWMVSWYDAATYCGWAGKRLPTEAEWERAARGPNDWTYPWGEDGPTCTRAVFFTGQTLCERRPQAVTSRAGRGDSAEGVRGMAGNVAEWVADVYARYSEDGAPQIDPQGPPEGPYRVVRGGGYREAGASLRGSARWGADPTGRSSGIGLRCAVRP